ncbi:MAG: hypothetical protein P3X24_000085 [bacterium]|nr:hypothetical protein [bacterium]
MLRGVFGLGLWGALLLVWGQPLVDLRVQPLLGDRTPAYGVFPLAVQLESKSGNYQGVLTVSLGGFGFRREYQYPLELPAGSRKVIIATPTVGGYADRVTVRFTARGIDIEARQPIREILETDRLAVLVGDAIGGLAVLERVRTLAVPNAVSLRGRDNPPSFYKVAYCRPELLPEQPIALSGAQLIILGAGAERLRAEQWNALRRWVMLGGVLVVPGGASAVYLQDPTLREWLPVAPQGTHTVSQLRALGDWIRARPPQGAATLTQSTPRAGRVLLKQDGVPLVAGRPYGLGAIMFLAFNPMDAPLRDYDARARLWQRLLDQVASFAPGYMIGIVYQDQSGYSVGSRYTSSNPLDIQPPSVTLIVVILSLYFLLVVPVNYFVLKRLRALDWAWVVTPLVALAFVGLLWWLAGDLYRKSLSSAVKTLIVAHAGSSDAYAINSALLFFPRAGVYDLLFEQSDSVEAGAFDDFNARQGVLVRTVHGEPTRMAGYRVTNLSFQWFRYTRIVQLQGQVEGTLRIEQRGRQTRLVGTLTNRLPYALSDVRLLTPWGVHPMGSLTPRQTVAIDTTSLAPLDRQPLPDWHAGSGWTYGSPAPSWEAALSALLAGRESGGVAYLIAQASEPVLTPELRDAAQRSAQVTYLISFPLEGAL